MAKKVLRTIKGIDLKGRRVLLRTGWDVPLEKSKIQNPKSKIKVLDDIRIRESLPTIKYLIDHQVASITIAFHIGRPEGKVVAELSVGPVVEKLIGLLPKIYPDRMTNDKFQMSNQTPMTNTQLDIGHSALISHLSLEIRHLSHQPLDIYEVMGLPISIKVYENLRFDPREESNDEVFAKELAAGHDLYINDAFSNCHREHASMVAITKFLPAYAGLLVEDEIKHLSLLQHNLSRPFVVVIGGAKIEDKIGVIEYFSKHADAVLLGGKTGLEYKNSKLQIPNAKLLTSNTLTSNIYPPIDDINGYDIGPKTIAKFSEKIQTAQTLFWNGNMGRSEDERFATGTLKLARAIADSAAKIKIVGGGDTTAYLHQNGLAGRFTFLSSGGGATLDYLAGQAMPGLEPLSN